MDAVPDAPPITVWGVLRAGSADAVPSHAPHGLAGLVVVVDGGGPRPSARRSPTVLCVGAPAAAPRAFAVAIRHLPARAEAIAWLDGTLPASDVLGRLVGHLGRRDAVVVASPVSDAVKRVRGGLVVGGVPRDGLCRPTAPLLVRALAARERLLPALEHGHAIFDALAVAGCTVAVAPRGTPAKT